MCLGAKGKSATVLQKTSLIRRLAQDGNTDVEIAKQLGIAPSTLYEYKRKFPEISEALKKDKDISVLLAEDALIMAATGYTYEEITTEVLKHSVKGEPILDEDGNPKMIVTKIVKKHAAPNIAAIKYLLNNRHPQRWSDRKGGTEVVADSGDDWNM